MVGDHHSGANSSYKEHDVRKGEQTRQEIIRKAAPIFSQKAYERAVFRAAQAILKNEAAELITPPSFD